MKFPIGNFIFGADQKQSFRSETLGRNENDQGIFTNAEHYFSSRINP